LATSLIRESPTISWPADQVTRLTLTVTLPAGRALTDWASFLLTIREDPEYPRAGTTKATATSADPVGDEWASSLTASGTVATATTITFDFAVPSSPGYRRYRLDIWALDGTADDVPLFPSTWLTVTARTR
jgi:hypothetical protein